MVLPTHLTFAGFMLLHIDYFLDSILVPNIKFLLCFRYTLSDPNVIQYINQNTLMWGCAVESPEGYRVAQSVGARKYPLICVVVLRENRMTIVGRIEGACSPELLISRLVRVLGDNEIHLVRARSDR